MKETITKATLDRYLQSSSIDEGTKDRLRKEFDAAEGDRKVLDEAVRLNGRKSMRKVSVAQTK
jgi:hypothetical protein